MAELKRRLLNLAISADQFIWNCATLGNADPDMTLSANAYASEIHGKRWARIVRPLIDMLFRPIERNHCHKAFLSELRRRDALKLPGAA